MTNPDPAKALPPTHNTASIHAPTTMVQAGHISGSVHLNQPRGRRSPAGVAVAALGAVLIVAGTFAAPWATGGFFRPNITYSDLGALMAGMDASGLEGMAGTAPYLSAYFSYGGVLSVVLVSVLGLAATWPTGRGARPTTRGVAFLAALGAVGALLAAMMELENLVTMAPSIGVPIAGYGLVVVATLIGPGQVQRG
ncbi:hypothetical protein [Actinokineospora globicatena]|uniref:Uncharacterized protein n=1 Tax=Actinokineospora globicatena TaxID=103729 RepID=A0A9W6QF72_9PSEU|nr:hypothetical protein [Actinokineospora globicatena]GLW89836.1 hypothetical protein Aglo03_06520 [Actinokineospora globicatena]